MKQTPRSAHAHVRTDGFLCSITRAVQLEIIFSIHSSLNGRILQGLCKVSMGPSDRKDFSCVCTYVCLQQFHLHLGMRRTPHFKTLKYHTSKNRSAVEVDPGNGISIDR